MADNIRQARTEDKYRIAEIIVTNYRLNFYPHLKTDEYFFDELNVVDTAEEYTDDVLKETYVYDDGIIRGVIRLHGDEVEKLFVEPAFQGQHIGERLLDFAVNEHNASWLWVLEYNKRGIAFYERHGFTLTGEKQLEDGWVPLYKMVRHI